MKWRVPGQEVYQRKLGEILCKKTEKACLVADKQLQPKQIQRSLRTRE